MLPYAAEPQVQGRRFPFFTILIILINIAVFAYEVSLGSGRVDEFAIRWGFIPSDLWSGRHLETLITAQFLHGGVLHIAGNMLFLWVFGDNVEDQLGHLTYLIFYLVCGIVASLTFAIAFPHSTDPLIGASGAIAGVLGGYLLLYPRALVRTLLTFGPFFAITRIAAVIVIGFWFILQILSSVASLAEVTPQSDVAYFAHVGGFIFGLIATGLIRESRDQQISYWSRVPWFSASFRNFLLLVIAVTVAGAVGGALFGEDPLRDATFRFFIGAVIVGLALFDGIQRLRGRRGLLGSPSRINRLVAIFQIVAALSLASAMLATS
jgi:membrane associated rhomboid family serine protease